jgi:hypothetical protein
MFVIGDTLKIKDTDVIGTVSQVKKEVINETITYYITIVNSYGLFTLAESGFERVQVEQS